MKVIWFLTGASIGSGLLMPGSILTKVNLLHRGRNWGGQGGQGHSNWCISRKKIGLLSFNSNLVYNSVPVAIRPAAKVPCSPSFQLYPASK